MTEPNWIIVTIIGALAGFLFPYIVKLPIYLVSLFRKVPVEGCWNVYHLTKENGESKVQYDVFEIRKGYTKKFLVNSYLEKNKKKLNAKGFVFFERNFWLMRLKTIRHDEEILIRLKNPIPTDSTTTWGIWLGIDYDGNTIAAPIVLSRKELSTNEATNLLLEKVKITTKMRILTSE